MIATDVGRAALLCTVPAAYALDVLTLGQLYGVAFAAGVLTVLFGVSDASLFVAIVPRERYVEANSLLNGSRAFSLVAGPSLSGLLVQAFSAPGALLLDAFSFLGSGALLARIHPEEPPPDPEQGGVLVGLRWVARSPSCARRSSPRRRSTSSTSSSSHCSSCTPPEPSTSRPRRSAWCWAQAPSERSSVRAAVTGRVTRTIGVGPALIVGAFTAPLLLVPLAAGSDAVVLACLFLAEFGSGLGVMLLDISAGPSSRP